MAFVKWWNCIEGVLYLMTGWYLTEVLLAFATYSIKELLTIDKVGSLIVSVVVCGFWIARYRMIKSKNKKEDKLLDLEIKIKEMHLNRKDMEEEHEKLLKRDM